MQTFVINLARRPDRMQSMHRQLSDMGISYCRIDALDAKTASQNELTDGFDISRGITVMPGDMACSQSHKRVWKAFLQTDDAYCVILEDDVVFAAGSAFYLKNVDWIPPNIDLIKLELTGALDRRILVRKFIRVSDDHRIGLLCTRHSGSGGYVLSRRGAEILMQHRTCRSPIDQLLFNPDASPLYRVLKPCQMVPAIARQREDELQRSDLIAERMQHRKSNKLLKKRIRRLYGECRQLPRQIVAILLGGRFVKVCPAQAFEPADTRHTP